MGRRDAGWPTTERRGHRPRSGPSRAFILAIEVGHSLAALEGGHKALESRLRQAALIYTVSLASALGEGLMIAASVSSSVFNASGARRAVRMNAPSVLRVGGVYNWRASRATGFLNWMAGLLPEDQRARFVEEQAGSMASIASQWECVVYLIDLFVEMPRTAWVYRYERRRNTRR